MTPSGQDSAAKVQPQRKPCFTLPSKTGCEGGLILVGSGIWPQSFEAFSETSVNSSEAGVRHVFVLVCREAFREKSYFGFDISRFINPGGHERPGTGRAVGCLSREIILRPRRERPRPSPLRDRHHLELPVDSLRDPFVSSLLSRGGEHGENSRRRRDAFNPGISC